MVLLLVVSVIAGGASDCVDVDDDGINAFDSIVSKSLVTKLDVSNPFERKAIGQLVTMKFGKVRMLSLLTFFKEILQLHDTCRTQFLVTLIMFQ
jgi:hypothetical protein